MLFCCPSLSFSRLSKTPSIMDSNRCRTAAWCISMPWNAAGAWCFQWKTTASGWTRNRSAGCSSQKPQDSHGIGVVNVHSRIRLLFGEPYGLFYSSRSGCGTRVEILLPMLTEEKEAEG